ncbi:MAG: hypothetical protein V4511_03780 [Bacteroidota bacterium]
MKKIEILAVFVLAVLFSCRKSSMDDFEIIKDKIGGSSSGTSASKMLGIWERDDNQATTFLKIEGTVATTCNSGTETVGTFNSSVPSATFVVSGTTYEFKMEMQGEILILGVPTNSTNPNHVPTEYKKYTDPWPCSGGGGGGGSTNCFVGAVWKKSDCNGAIYNIQFSSNNTGYMTYTGCSPYNILSSRYEFNWTESGGSITYTYTHCYKPQGTTIANLNGGSQSYTCTSTTFTTGGSTWTH